jgi:RNA polymerase sigma factor (sigma-70 family)
MRDHDLHLATELATELAAAAPEADRALEFDLFFEHERARLFQALCLVTRNRFEAEELAQDAFLAVYERWDRIREMDDPTGYLYQTAMNAFRSWHRRSALAAKRAIGLTTADDSIEQLEEQDVVVRALAPLSARQRAAVVLIDLLGYSSDEAGRMLGIRSSTVRTHVERAHRDLKARLEDSHG